MKNIRKFTVTTVSQLAMCLSILLLSEVVTAAPCNESGSGTALERAATGLGAGEWCDFDAAEPPGLADLLAVSPGDIDTLLEYSHGAQWDPVNGLWVFHGYGYPPVVAAMVVYKESSNTWYAFKGEPFAPDGNGHDYDQTAVDPETGYAYYRPRLGNTVYRAVWNDSNNQYSWDSSSVTPISGGCPSQASHEANGWAWDSKRNGIVMLSYADGGVVCFWDRDTNVWSKDANVNVTGGYHQVAEWDFVHEIMWLNDYEPNNAHWKDVDGVVTKQSSSPPFTLGCCGSGGALSTSDPVTGVFIVTKDTGGSRPWWEYDVSTDQWAQIAGSMPPVGRNDESIAGPVTDHGVIMYVTWDLGDPQLFLYRHAPGGGSAGPALDFSASVETVAEGGTTTLTWSSPDATSCTASGGWSGGKPVSGSETVGPLAVDTTFTLSCSNADGSSERSVMVEVVGQPVLSFVANPTSIVPGGNSVLSWNATDASSCAASGAWTGTKPPSGSEVVGPLSSDSTFSLNCSGVGGSASASVTVTTDADPGEQTVLLFEDFEGYAVGTDPTGWLDTGGNNSLSEDQAKFKVFEIDGNKAFGTSDISSTNIHSHVNVAGSELFSNYEYSGRMRVSGAADGIGVTVLSDFPNSDSYYRLRREGPGSFQISTHGSGLACAGTTDTGVTPLPNTWYWFRVQAEDMGSETEIRAKVWQEGSAEPSSWQAVCGDTGTRRNFGTVGVWAVVSGQDSGTKYWDNLDGRTLFEAGAAPTLSLSAEPTTVQESGSTTLQWNASNVDSCDASGGWSGSRAISGTEVAGPLSQDTTFTLVCSKATGGSISQSVTVLVETDAVAPTLTLSASPNPVDTGGSTTLSWTTSNADTCTATGGWSGDKATNGSESVGPLESTTTFTQTCDGPGGSVTESVSVTVNASNPPPPPDTTSDGGGGAISLLSIFLLIATLAGKVVSRIGSFQNKSTTMRAWRARHSTSAILFVILFLSFTGLPEVAVAVDWEVRSTHPDVVYSNRFDDYDNDFYANLFPNPDNDRRSSYYDTQVKASGAGSLRFDIIPGGSGFGGELAVSLGDDPAAQFGAGDEFWVQWRQRFDPYVIDHQYATTSGSGQWKQLIIGQGQLPGQSRWDTRSCTENDIVVQNISGQKYPQSYHGCWVYLNITSSSGNAISRMNLGDETGDPGADVTERWPCQYWPPGSRIDGCRFYAADQWMTFMVHVQLGPAGEATSSIGGGPTKGFINSTYELYMAYDSEELELVHRKTGIVFRRGNYDDDPRNSSHDAKFGMFRWTPYLTQKDSAEDHQTASTWIDEIIISRSFVESPGSTGPSIAFSASVETVAEGGTTTLTWSSPDATSCTASGGWSGGKPVSGSETVGPLAVDTTFTLSCSNADGSSERSVMVEVVGQPVLSFVANPTSIVPGGNSVLSWNATDASSCAASGAWTGTKPPSGSEVVGPLSSDSTFSLNCSGVGGSASASVTVTTDADPGEQTVLLFEDFEGYAVGTDPTGWLDTGGNNSLSEDQAKFKVFEIDGNKAFGTSDISSTNIHSHVNVAGSELFSNYEYSGRMRVSGAADGIGVTVLSDFPNSDSYYRLRREGPGSFQISTHGSGLACAGTTDTGVTPLPNTWYWFRVQAEDMGSETEIRAKVWQEGSAEPSSWQAVCGDTGTRRNFGTVGVWAVVSGQDSGTKYWDNLDGRTLFEAGAAPTLSLSAEPTTVQESGSTTLQWNASNVDSCDASGGWSGSRAISGTEVAGPLSQDTTFTLVCSKATGGSISQSVTVLVETDAVAPTLTLSASPNPVDTGGSTTLSWTTSNADTCTATGGWSGDKATNGSESVGPLESTTTFTQTCDGPGGSVTESVSVTVNASNPPPPPDTTSDGGGGAVSLLSILLLLLRWGHKTGVLRRRSTAM